ncbi:MAG: hypothetical protein GDA36_01330 [Rhodobacteraceae bacterium]|nr:hypothetical protein [Paracoccaceae bacterium]
MRLGGVQGWFAGPVVARFVSNAVRIGADDVLTEIDAPVDWRWWCSPTRKRGLRCSGIRSRGYDSLVRFNCLLIGQWHGPRDQKLARALNCGWISCLFAAPARMHLCPMKRPIAVFAMRW